MVYYQIPAQDFLGLVLAYESCMRTSMGQRVTGFCNNQSVFDVILNGFAGVTAGDLNVMTGHWWMNVVKDSVGIQILDGIGRTDGHL